MWAQQFMLQCGTSISISIGISIRLALVCDCYGPAHGYVAAMQMATMRLW